MHGGTRLSLGEVGEGSEPFCGCDGPASLCFLPGPSAGEDGVPAGVEGRPLPEPGPSSRAIPDSSLSPLRAVSATLKLRKRSSHVSFLRLQIRLMVSLRGSNSGATHITCKEESCAGSLAFWEGRSFIYLSVQCALGQVLGAQQSPRQTRSLLSWR